MRCLLLSLALLAGAHGEEVNAYLGIFAETTEHKTAGMPAIQLPPGVDLSMLPPAARAMLAGGPKRGLSIRLWSDGIAPANATAVVFPPAGLGLGQRLNLALYRPRPGQTEAEGDGDAPVGVPDIEEHEFTLKRYWGSSATVKPGQPDVFSTKSITQAQKDEMRRAMEEAQRRAQQNQAGGGSYFFKPNWTTGYWPGGEGTDDSGLTAESRLVGDWRLESSYCGGVQLPVPATVSFLNGFQLTTPDLSKQPDFAKAMTFSWQPIPNCLGQYATIIGMKSEKELIIWVSSEAGPEPSWFEPYLQMAEVRQLVADNVFMAPTVTSVTVPAGIFKDCQMVSLTMQGWGNGAARDDSDPRPRLQTRCSLTVTLGGTMLSTGFSDGR